MYNYPPPGQYGRAPGYSGAPPGVAPGMGPPPGMGAPPTPVAAPGVAPPARLQGPPQLPGRPGGLPNFQTPNLPPNINFSAPVIRLTDAVQGARRESGQDSGNQRRGLGMGHDNRGGDSRQQGREANQVLIPPTKEEIARTIYIGNITEGVGDDEGVERILRSVGNLRKWVRVTDANNKPCKFGFAEYEDAESLETAAEVLKGVQVPVEKPGTVATEEKAEDSEVKAEVKDEPDVKMEEQHEEKEAKEKGTEEGELKTSTLLVSVDEASLRYADEWKARRQEDEAAAQFRIDSAKETLNSVLASLRNPQALAMRDHDGDSAMQEYRDPQALNAEVITIPLSADDELSDIPAAQRETVAAEIAAFRDRSNRRDLERLRREEEMEARERERNGLRTTRLASPPLTDNTGRFGGSANAIPLGPRGRGVQGAPSGPKGFKGAQIPQDYQDGVNFVNGGTTGTSWTPREDEDDSASDSELERRHKDRRQKELDKAFADAERTWLKREKNRGTALQREDQRQKEEDAQFQQRKEQMAQQLKEYDDDVEAEKKADDYYRDHTLWARNRTASRTVEAAQDHADRQAESRELAMEERKRAEARGMADTFLEQQAEELSSRLPAQAAPAPVEPTRFKMSLGAAAQKVQAAAQPRRTAAEVEFLLEDEDVTETAQKRKFVPIKFDPTAEYPEEDREAAQKQLANDIPTSTEDLFKWDVAWDFVDESIINDHLKGFVENKIVEFLGVQEEMLVDVVIEHLRNRKGPQELIGELEGALDEEAENLVKRLWRMLIFYSESEKRGISK
ncbi:hypothetical protein GQ43DRAFT_255475 [Delitschia confertaspora ATCC 74209]|uniref:PWI domain-containing protein n=1 Tax=Delitschia confertaspora ATCC 74209 TaxID=1513339 RepID=A0A9P4MMU5_9PLEO|nr:hypothetical protein GQ43DRAFT_255475 [Delitschia confertaspora ATCC 74209]